MKKHLAPLALGLSLAIALAMALLKPVPHGHRYDLAVQLSVGLALIGLLARAPFDKVFKGGVLLAVFAAGLAWGALNIATIDPGSEAIGYYRSAFEALDSGRNPYTSGTIFHRGEDGNPVYGNFNYPPAEIFPYYLAYRICGRWDSAVYTGTMLLINGLACLVLVLTFPKAGWASLAAFFPLFLFGEIKTNPSLTLLATALLIGLIIKERRRPGGLGPYLTAVVFGVGLMTKFLVLPLMAAYYWHGFDAKTRASLAPIGRGVGLALATSALVMAPFGITAVLKNTLLFNLILRDRAGLTTFYPNVLSGPLSALGLGAIYPVAAAAVVGLAVLTAPRQRHFPALLAAAFAFLLAAPTPEPQYLPVVLYLALAGVLLEKERDGLPEAPTPPARA